MSLRDQIISATKAETVDFPHEIVTIPEWGDLDVMVRGLSVGDKRRYMVRARRFEEGPNNKWVVVPKDDPLDDLYLVYLTTFEADGSARVFQESDIEQLAQAGEKTEQAVQRIVEVALRLSDLSQEPPEGAVTDEATAAGKDSATPTGEQSSSSPTT